LLLKIREEMAREADYDVDFFVEMVRNGIPPATDERYRLADSDNGKQVSSKSKTRSKSKSSASGGRYK
jgi:hypothetical protein